MKNNKNDFELILEGDENKEDMDKQFNEIINDMKNSKDKLIFGAIVKKDSKDNMFENFSYGNINIKK